MGKIITTRLPDEFVERLNYIAQQEGIDVSTVIRRLLTNAIKEWKIMTALENLRVNKFSIGKAAEFADVNLWEMLDLAKENSLNWTGYNEEDLKKDLKFLK